MPSFSPGRSIPVTDFPREQIPEWAEDAPNKGWFLLVEDDKVDVMIGVVFWQGFADEWQECNVAVTLDAH